MAVNVTGNPWTLDSADAGAGLIWNGNVFVEHIEFVGYALDTDTCQVTDRAGRIVWEGNGALDLQEVRSGKIHVAHDGIRVPVLTSGSLRIYIK